MIFDRLFECFALRYRNRREIKTQNSEFNFSFGRMRCFIFGVKNYELRLSFVIYLISRLSLIIMWQKFCCTIAFLSTWKYCRKMYRSSEVAKNLRAERISMFYFLFIICVMSVRTRWARKVCPLKGWNKNHCQISNGSKNIETYGKHLGRANEREFEKMGLEISGRSLATTYW